MEKIICPRCGNNNVSDLSISEFNRKEYGCQDCYYQWTPGFHQGLATHRLEENPLEQKFAKEWATIQEQGNILNYLLSPTNKLPDTTTTERDRRVAATVVQWLGSHVGQGFLRDVLGVEIPDFSKRQQQYVCPHCIGGFKDNEICQNCLEKGLCPYCLTLWSDEDFERFQQTLVNNKAFKCPQCEGVNDNG